MRNPFPIMEHMIQSIGRAFSVLEVLARAPGGVTDIASQLELPKSTVSRILGTLEELEAVERANGHYRLGPAVSALAAGIAPSRNLIAIARPHLEDLADDLNEAAGLSLPDGFNVHYVDQVECRNPVQVRDWTGSRIPMHVVSAGLVFLAAWPEADVEEYLARDLERLTPKTVTDPAQIKARLVKIAADDLAWVFEEFAEGIDSVAAPIRDHTGAVIAAAHSHGPSYRFPPEGKTDEVAARVRDAANRITAQLSAAGG